MHPARLSLLAQRHAPERAIVSRQRDGGGPTHFVLECGHTGDLVSHFDGSKVATWRCHECGVAAVKAHPMYAAEFAAEREAAPSLWEASH